MARAAEAPFLARRLFRSPAQSPDAWRGDGYAAPARLARRVERSGVARRHRRADGHGRRRAAGRTHARGNRRAADGAGGGRGGAAARSQDRAGHHQPARHFGHGAIGARRNPDADEERRHQARRAAGRDGSAACRAQIAGHRSGARHVRRAFRPQHGILHRLRVRAVVARRGRRGADRRRRPLRHAARGARREARRSRPSAAPSAPNACSPRAALREARDGCADPRHSVQGPAAGAGATPISPMPARR